MSLLIEDADCAVKKQYWSFTFSSSQFPKLSPPSPCPSFVNPVQRVVSTNYLFSRRKKSTIFSPENLFLCSVQSVVSTFHKSSSWEVLLVKIISFQIVQRCPLGSVRSILFWNFNNSFHKFSVNLYLEKVSWHDITHSIGTGPHLPCKANSEEENIHKSIAVLNFWLGCPADV